MATSTVAHTIVTDLDTTLVFSENMNGFDYYAMLGADNQWGAKFVRVVEGATDEQVVDALYQGALSD